MFDKEISALEALPVASSCRIIDFESSKIETGFVNDTYFLIVAGIKPWITMKVSLEPRIYIDQPDYWEIEVVGCQGGIGLPTTAPYSVALQLFGSMGKKGVEVVGASSSQKHDIP